MASIADIIRAGLKAGHADAAILAAVKAQHPSANTGVNSLRYYRNELKKTGPVAKPSPAAKAGPIPEVAIAALADELKAVLGRGTLTTIAGELTGRGGYSVRGIKTFRGMEGGGYNATLYRDGRKVADLIDDATGGELMIDWFDREAKRVEVVALRYDDTEHRYQGTPEEAALWAHCRSLPALPPEPERGITSSMRVSPDIFLDDLVNDAELLAKLRRMAAKKLVMVEDGKTFTLNAAPTPEALARCKAKYPKATFLNGLTADEAIQVAGRRA